MTKKKIVVYIPTEEEKKELILLGDEVIDLITIRCDNHIGKMSFVVSALYTSFIRGLKK